MTQLQWVSLLCGSFTAVALGSAGSERRLELVATDTILIFDATVAHEWICYCAEAATVAPVAALFPGVTRT